MKTITLKLDQIKAADWNPEHRSEESYCADLVSSYTSIDPETGQPFGQIIAALVSDNGDGTYTLVEGHRRYTACKVLGLPLVCQVCKPGSAARLYAEINSTAKRLDGRDKLHVYLTNREALDRHAQKECDKWDEGTLKYMAEHGAGIATFKQGRTVANYAGTDPDKTVRWLARYNLTYAIRRAIEDGTKPETIASAINNDKSLKPSWGMAA